MRQVLAIARVELRRFLRDRSNIFFALIFPLILVFVLGLQFGGGAASGQVAISGQDSALRDSIAQRLQDEGVAVTFAEPDAILQQVARARTDVGLLLPDGADTAYQAGEPVTVELVPSSSAVAAATQQRVSVALEGLQLERAQLMELTERGIDEAEATAALDAASGEAGPSLQVTDVDEIAQEFQGLGRFDLGAASQLLLFTFLASLAGSATLIQARRQKVIARSLAAPVTTTQVLLGHAAGRWVIAAFQGGYIMLATALLFGVSWGNPVLSLLVLAVFAAVAAGAAMLLGSVMDNEAAASGVGVGVGLVMAAIGGGMVPLEIFSDTLRTVAHITPHAWAYDAFAQIQRHDGSLADILPMLAVLTAFAVVVLAVGAWALRRSVARAM